MKECKAQVRTGYDEGDGGGEGAEMNEQEKFEKGKVSIVTPVFNGAAYLPQMLDSVLSQTYGQVEMILVDDGSTDETVQVAEHYRSKFAARGYDYRIVRAVHQNASAALNCGFPYVRGEFLIWPDGDDVLAPESIERRVSFLQENLQYNCVRSLSYYFDAKTGALVERNEQQGDLSNEMLFWDILEGRTYVCCGCYMVRSACFFDIYRNRHIPESDAGQNFQMLLPFMYRHKCPAIREELYGVCVRAGSHSRQILNEAEEEERYDAFERLVDELAAICEIKDEPSKDRLMRWKLERRYNLAVKYGRKKRAGKILWRMYQTKGFGKRDIMKKFLWAFAHHSR